MACAGGCLALLPLACLLPGILPRDRGFRQSRKPRILDRLLFLRCCELNTTAHELLVDIGSEIGAYNAAESGESLAECIALEVNRVRQRLAVQIWRDYQDHINARIRFADPDEDDKRRHEEEAQVDAEVQELAARRLFNEAYLQRMGRPQAFGLG